MLLAGFVAVTFLFKVSWAVDEAVVFSAGITTNTTIDKNTTIVFHHVFSNKGNGYNGENGIFTAPRSGFYVFHIHVAAAIRKFAYINLFKTGEYLVSAYANNMEDDDSGGNTVAVELAKGDTVYVMTTWRAGLYNQENEIFATFSGHFVTA